MTAYDILCLVLCVFAVFGGYIALKLAAEAVLRPRSRSDKCGVDCDKCESRSVCPEKRSAAPQDEKKD